MRRALGGCLALLLIGGAPRLATAANDEAKAAPPLLQDTAVPPPMTQEQAGLPPPTQQEEAPLAPPRRRAGDHLLAELGLGANLGSQTGFQLSTLLGGGGRLPHTPISLYFVAELALGALSRDGVTRLGLDYQDDRLQGDLGLGLRIYLPVQGRLRLHFDGIGGGSFVSAHLERQRLEQRDAEGWVGQFAVGAGLQYRLSRNVSLGVRGRVGLNTPDLAGLWSMVGEPAPRKTSLIGGISWHY